MTLDDTTALSTGALQLPYRWGEHGMSAPEQAFALPSGTVTFLLTDIEGSTRMWTQEPAEAMRATIVRHVEILAEVVGAHGGVRPQEQGEGDSIVAAFARPSDALRAALAAQLALGDEDWPTTTAPLVRMALHTGEAQLRDDANYAGQAIIRCARLRAIGHGGQVLVSGATRDLAMDQNAEEFAFLALGEHRLRDLGRPETVWQLAHPDLRREFPPVLSLETAPHNLPAALSPFIGRLPEIDALSELVRTERLVTATGSGGAGKTRLAQQAGAEVLHEFPGGVWWVELAPVAEPDVEAAVRAALGIGDLSTLTLEASVAGKLNGRPGLLIVDNCEHVAATIAPLVDRLLRTEPCLKVLATSRVALDVPGERTWRVPPLSLPGRAAATTVEALAQFDAVRLFCDRARRARPNFRLTEANGATIAELCHRLGGIPLALELAAARCRMLSPAEVLDGLSDALRVLGHGSRVDLPRQQTLEASIAWSVDLLSPEERLLLTRLAVFVDGCTLDAAEAVGTGGLLAAGAVFDTLDRLVDHSLVQVDDAGGETRFHMLETVVQFTRRLAAADPADADATRDRHAAYYAALLDRFETRCGVDELFELQDRVADDDANVTVAFDHLVAQGDVGTAAAMLFPFVGLFEHHRSTLRMANALLAHPATTGAVEWRALFIRGVAQIDASEYGEVFSDLGAAVELARSLGHESDARFSQLVLDFCLTIADIGALETMLEARHWFEAGGDHRRASFADALLAYVGHRQLDVARAAIERFDLTASRSAEPRTVAIVSMARLAVQVEDCVPLDQNACAALVDNRRLMPQVRVGAAALANADAASRRLPMVADVAQFEELDRIEGSLWARVAPFNAAALEALQRDDLDGARSVWLKMAPALGRLIVLPGFWTLTGLALVRVGIAEPPPVPDASNRSANATRFRLAKAAQLLAAGQAPAARDQLGQIGADVAATGARRFIYTYLELTVLAGADTKASLEAARLMACCDRFAEAVGLVRMPYAQRAWDRARALLADELEDDLGQALEEGRELSLERGIELACRSHAATATATFGWAALTPTELRVATLAADGRTNPQIGTELLMSPETAKTHLSRVFTKLGIAGRRELPLAFAQRDGQP